MLVVIIARVNQTSIWERCKDTDSTPCDDTTLRWLHTLNREWLELVANRKPVMLAMNYVCNDEDEAGAGEYSLAPIENYLFEIGLLLADSGFYNEQVMRRSPWHCSD